MKRFYLSKLITLAALLLGWSVGASAQTVTYLYTGSVQTYVVPLGVTSIAVDAIGGAGGGNYASYGSPGPVVLGGRVQCHMNVTPGNTLYLYVGQQGETDGSGSYTPYGGWNGGQSGQAYSAGGGGASDIRLSNVTVGTYSTVFVNPGYRVVVAGAGGGGGDWGTTGGLGGGLTGGTGPQYCCGYGTAGGGTQVGPGVGGNAASLGIGGTSGSSAGGGAGGYYGGNGGTSSGGGGGGGSSYTDGTLCNTVTLTQGYTGANGNGVIRITPLSPNIVAVPAALDFGYIAVGTFSVPQYVVVTGSSLLPATGTVNINPPAAGYQISLDGVTWTYGSIPVSYGSVIAGSFGPMNLYVQFNPGLPICYNGSPINFTGGGLTTAQVPVAGCGVAPCSGSPVAGNAVVTPTTGGSGTQFGLSLTGSSAAAGLTYQWQSAPAATGPWTAIPGAVTYTYNFIGISANTYFRCVVSCGATSVNSASTEATFSAGNYANPCSGTPNPGIVFSPVKAGCSAYGASLYDVGATTDSGVTHQWQSSVDGLSWPNVLGGNAREISQSISGTIYYRDVVTCNISMQSATSPVDSLVLNPTPNPITGVTNICTATPVVLTETTTGGTWSISNPAIAGIVTSGITGIVTGTGAGTATISYTLGTGCNATVPVTVNTSPAAITGTTSVCTSQTTTLNETTTGGAWSSSNTANATVGSTGKVTGVTAPNTPNISYTMPSGCYSFTTVTVNQLPAAITGTGAVCVGATTLLSDAITGGTWVSSNSFDASIDPHTGLVSGIVASFPVISYTLPGGCYATKPITVNSLPAPITGSVNVCVGATNALSDAPGGTWASQYNTVATVGASTGIVSGVAAGTSTITYTSPGTSCQITMTQTVNVLPAVFTVTGGGGFCFGGSGAHVGLSGSSVGINYQLYYGGTAYLSPIPGTTSGLDFGLLTGVGTYTVQATDGTFGCTSNMAGSTSITIDALPNIYNLSVVGSGSYCAGSPGVDLILSGSDLGVNYQVYDAGTLLPVGLAVTGTGLAAPLDLGIHTTPNTTSFYVVATNATTLCTSNMNGTATITVNAPPSVYTLMSSAASYCVGGTGVDITLSGSTPGVTYTVLKGGTSLPSMTGTGSALDFSFNTAGCYTAIAFDPSTSCSSNMSGSFCITTNALPVAYTVTGGGGYCAGSTGAHVGLSYSSIGTSYELLLGGVHTGNIKLGSNSGLDFGLLTTAGVYTVQATNLAGCQLMMTGSVTITIEPLPNSTYTVSGGGPYCAGTTGSDITLTGSDVGIGYKLFLNGTTLVNTMSGTGSALNFGLHTVVGNYTIVGVNTATGCTANMTGGVNISIIPFLNLYTLSVSGSAHFCAGTSSNNLMLSGSDIGVNYALYVNGGYVTTMSGTGSALNFGAQPVGGVYTCVATNPTTGCTRNMPGGPTLILDPVPATYAVTETGGGNYCAGGTGQHIGLAVSNSGINYKITPSGITLGGTGASLDFGIFTTAGTYTVEATNPISGCQSSMAGSATITIIAPPTPYTLTSAGNYCVGGIGSEVQLSGSVLGDTYYLYKGSSIVNTMAGTGSALVFGSYTVGTYSATALDNTYGCTSNMANSPIIATNPLPNPYTVTGSGHYCAGGVGVPVGLSNSTLGVSYQLYNSSGIIVGADSAGTGTAINFGLETSADTYTIVATNNTTTCNKMMSGSAVVSIDTLVVPAVSITTAADTVCNGASATFTATPVNGGLAPAYQWRVNGANMTAVGNMFTYAPAASDVVTALLTSNATCALPSDSANSNSVTMAINPGVTPAVTISTPNNVLCASATAVTFTAAPVSPGTAPIYEWKKNGSIVGTNSPTYSTVVADGDVVFAIMASNVNCNLVPFVYAPPITMTVVTPVTPVFTITADPGTEIQHGQPVTFTAWVPIVAGVTNKYQWSVNSAVQSGATSGVFTSSSLPDGAQVSCTVTSVTGSCGSESGTQDLFMSVGTTNVVQVSNNGDVRVIPNPNKGVFTVKGSLGTTNDQEVSLEITDMLGQVVYTNKVMAQGGNINEQIQLSNSLANGMYILNLRSGADTKAFHFVIEQ